MIRYIFYKFFMMLFTLWIIITSVFFIMKALPGGPFDLEKQLPAGVKLELEKKYGLDLPISTQYLNYVKNLVRLDLGISYKDVGVKVTDIIKSSFKYSALIGLTSILFAIVFGLFFGVIISQKYKIFNLLISCISTFGVATPNFILAIFFIYFFGEYLSILPVGNIYSWKCYIGPIFILSIYPTSFIIKLVRANIAKILNEYYVNVFKAYGVSRQKILFKYAIREVLIPVITYIAPMLASIMMGSFAIEKIFAIPGLGKVFIDSVINRDYYVTFGLVLFFATLYLLVVFIADISYFIVDPRLKLSLQPYHSSNI